MMDRHPPRTDAAATRSDWPGRLALAALWILMVWTVSPRGDFPLNDDWSYGAAVRTLLETGEIRYPGWVSMSLLTQVLWGALFCLPFGFSFTALRLSTLTLGLAGIWAVQALLRECGADRRTAFLGAAAVAVCPVYFNLSCTFMTDVPFFALGAGAAWLLLRGLRSGKRLDLAAGTVLACAATLVRELALVLPLAFGAAWLFHPGRRRLFPALLCLALLPAACHFGFRLYLEQGPGLPALFDVPRDLLRQSLGEGLPRVAARAARGTLALALYLGLFLPPFLFAGDGHRRRLRSLAAGFALFILFALAWRMALPLPGKGNILYNLGLGPALLYDVLGLDLPRLPHLPQAIWWGATLAAALCAGCLLAAGGTALRRARRGEAPWRVAFLAAAFGAYSVPLVLNAKTFDRYYLFLLPFVLALAVLGSGGETAGRLFRRPMAVAAGGILLALTAVFSVAATHDYLAWNRARWQALDTLVLEQKVSPTQIDGGFEFNGTYGFQYPFYPPDGVRWWWVRGDRYTLAFGPLEGYREWLRQEYMQWLPPRRKAVLVLRKIEAEGKR